MSVFTTLDINLLQTFSWKEVLQNFMEFFICISFCRYWFLDVTFKRQGLYNSLLWACGLEQMWLNEIQQLPQSLLIFFLYKTAQKQWRTSLGWYNHCLWYKVTGDPYKAYYLMIDTDNKAAE